MQIFVIIIPGGRSGDMVQIKCAFCKITIPVTESVNSADALDRCHYSLKPDCPFMRGEYGNALRFWVKLSSLYKYQNDACGVKQQS